MRSRASATAARQGRRNARREAAALRPSDYRDAEGNVLELRGSLTPAARARVRRRARRRTAPRGRLAARDRAAVRAAAVVLDDRRRARSTARRSCSARYRMATAGERRFVRDALREHLAEHFPELQAP